VLPPQKTETNILELENKVEKLINSFNEITRTSTNCRDFDFFYPEEVKKEKIQKLLGGILIVGDGQLDLYNIRIRKKIRNLKKNNH